MHQHALFPPHKQSGFLQEHKARLALEIASLRRQAEAFNSPSTYVKCAKFQRLANAKEKELSALQASGGVSVQDRLDAAVAVCKVFVSRLFVLLVGCKTHTILTKQHKQHKQHKKHKKQKNKKTNSLRSSRSSWSSAGARRSSTCPRT